MTEFFNGRDYNDNDFDSVEYNGNYFDSVEYEDDMDNFDYGCRPNEDTLGPCIGQTATLEDMERLREELRQMAQVVIDILPPTESQRFFEYFIREVDLPMLENISVQREFDSMREKGF